MEIDEGPATGTPAVVLSSLEPVVPLPMAFDSAAVVKALILEEESRRAEAAAAARQAEERASRCAVGDAGFETVRSWVRAAGTELRCRFDVDTVFGVAGRAGSSDHPGGLALDLMVGPDPGADLADYAVANMNRLGIEYVIYRQRINTGSGWEAMEDRGGATANHMDHVHLSFEDR